MSAPAKYPEPNAPQRALTSFLADYELRGEDEDGRDGCYRPNDTERYLIEDFVWGLMEDADWLAAIAAAREQDRARAAAPIDMVLHCPKCRMQHIDAAEEVPGMPIHKSAPTPDHPHRMVQVGTYTGQGEWTNPPHRSHLCRPEDGGCGHIWRPADVPTNGVAAVKTTGKADSPIAAAPQAAVGVSDEQIKGAIACCLGFDWPHIPQTIERFHLLSLARAVLALSPATKPEAPADKLHQIVAEFKAMPLAQQVDELKAMDGTDVEQFLRQFAPAGAPANEGALCSYCGGSGDVHSTDGEWRGICTCEAGVEIRIQSAVNEALCSILPGPYYMDPPDGGDVSPLEQCQRMAEDAAKFRASPVTTQAARDVLAERQRQISAEGWTPKHDDEHVNTLGEPEMAIAAACYAMAGTSRGETMRRLWWPWAAKWWKPTTPRRNLEKAGALILAEMERLDRATARTRPDGLPAWICKGCSNPNFCVSIQGCDTEEINK